MRSSGPILRPRPPRSNSQPQPLNPFQPSTTISQELAVQAALETLDNTHSFMLLQSTYITLPSLLCQRTRLSHLLDQHRNCLEFSAHSLSAAPKCTHCLEVLLTHLAEGLDMSQSLRKELIVLLPSLGVKKGIEGVLHLAKLAPGAKKYERLIEELSADRCELSKITVLQVQSNDRKIIAKAHILIDQRILFVPLEKLITLQVSRNHPLVQKLYQQRVNLKSPKHTQLAVFLLHQLQKGQTSPYYQYLLTLPNDFSRFPINYSPQLLEELKGSCFLQIIETKRLEIQKDYEYVTRLQPSFSRFGLVKFMQTRLIVCSRVFGISIAGIKTDALVPVADMLNHQLPKQTSWFYCDQSRGFVIQSMSEIPPGAEIFDSYGQKCNSRFLLNYGFALANNHHNEVTLLVRFSPHLAMFPVSYRIRLTRSIQSKCFQEAMGVLRYAGAIQENNDSDSDDYDIGENARLTPFKSFENQIKAWQLLQGLIRDQLRQYQTSISEDRKFLQTAKGSLRDIIILRKGEKQIFQYYLTMARKIIKFFQNKENRKVLALYDAYISTLPIDGVIQQ